MVRCDGGPDVGLGHVVRCLALADALRDAHGCRVRFLVRKGPVAKSIILKAGYLVSEPADGLDEETWIRQVIERECPAALLMDFRAGLSPLAVERWRRRGILMISIDDPEYKRVACDLLFFPPIPQVDYLDWSGFTGELYVGWEWVVLREQFGTIGRVRKVNSQPLVLVTMGGSDPEGLTLKAVKALDSMHDAFNVVVILGAAFCHKQKLQEILSRTRRGFEVRSNVTNMAEVMAETDLAVASFAVTAYELAAMRVPGVYLCLSEDHALSASAFSKAGIALVLGVFATVTQQALADGIRYLLNDSAARCTMAQRCAELVDGRGAQRTAQVIAKRLQARNAKT